MAKGVHARCTSNGRCAVALAAAGLLAACGSAGGFEPQRAFPDTWDRIHVFVDQLNIASCSPAQLQFAASHYAGTQKQVSRRIDDIRVYNDDFIMLQYRLGVRESGHKVDYIHDDTWSSDWDTIDPHEDWFIHDDQGNRVFQLYNGWLEEYCMDISGQVNGNTTYGWKEYWVDCVIADVDASHGDGVFADSTHLPYAVPDYLWDSPIGAPPHTPYIPHMEAFYDYVYPQFDQADRYFIPNIGGLCTTLDTTTGYYQDVHGAMVEGFATKLSNYDWKLQQNRTLNLIRNGKIYIAQSGAGGHADIAGRQWLLGNFLLLKHDRSFVNILGAGDQLHWWPEYDVPLSAPASAAVPDHIDEMKDASGIYARPYQHGLVLVNPTGSARSYSLPEASAFLLVTPYGGGRILSDGQIERPSGLIYTRQEGHITLAGWSAAILLETVPGDAGLDWEVGVLDLAVVANHFGEGEATWTRGDLNGDGVVDVLDMAIVANHFGETAGGAAPVPEPTVMLLTALGTALLLPRRRWR